MKILTQSIVLTLLTTNLTFANVTDTTNNYAAMSTVELQKTVELYSQAGDLPFEMGLELMKRWTNS